MPSVTDWITAITAILALVAATVAGRTAGRLYRIESDRDSAMALRAEREQASGVNAWCVVTNTEANRRDGLLVSNASDSPVYDVEVISCGPGGGQQFPLTLFVLPPGHYVALEEASFHWTFPQAAADVDGSIRPVTKHKTWRVVRLSFTDAHGIAWVRDDHGRLSQSAMQGRA
ncbi:hypothetical protein [Propioniciclava soli]|uniref:hypothetical protein n=1 Tax=Propioniciclava soli TaxID=2775081 RepID=UPI001E3FE8BE|nr:hypothetical protein [Propioniciclava soli]